MTVLAVKSRTIAFETLSCNGEQVTIENDLDNEQQTLHFPILGTTADKLLDGITYDGLHPNAKGYQIMATVLKNTLKKNGIRI